MASKKKKQEIELQAKDDALQKDGMKDNIGQPTSINLGADNLNDLDADDDIINETEFSYELKIPRDRIAVLIGKSGEIKKQIESETHTTLKINSKDGDVTISGEDALGLYTAREVIRAISRGFNPGYAILLLKADYAFEIFNIAEFSGRNKNSLARLKGRVIGKDGKARKIIEELTEAHICVYGKTVGIIGEIENVSIARRAVQSLLTGAPHSNVYKWLEHRRKELKMKSMIGKEI